MTTQDSAVNPYPAAHPSAVLAHSRHTGSHLLVLLVVAVNAGPSGLWTTDQATLQRQARLSRRRIRQILPELVTSGELAVVPGKGRGHRSTFQLLPPFPPFPPDPLSPLIPPKTKTEETFGLVRRPLAGQQRTVFQINLMFHQAGIPLPPPAQIVLWSKTLGGIEPLVDVLTRLIQAGLATKNNPAAYVHRVVMNQAAGRRAAPGETEGTASAAGTRRSQAARLAGLGGFEPFAEQQSCEHRPQSRRRRSGRSPR